jgi:hypothetical protein
VCAWVFCCCWKYNCCRPLRWVCKLQTLHLRSQQLVTAIKLALLSGVECSCRTGEANVQQVACLFCMRLFEPANTCCTVLPASTNPALLLPANRLCSIHHVLHHITAPLLLPASGCCSCLRARIRSGQRQLHAVRCGLLVRWHFIGCLPDVQGHPLREWQCG